MISEYILGQVSAYEVAAWYSAQNKPIEAFSYFIRSADLNENTYRSLVHASRCLQIIGGRPNSVRALLFRAISVEPNSDRAYYALAKHYESIGEWENCHCFSSIGASLAGPYKPRLLFLRSLSAWWLGYASESRKVLQTIVDVHWDELDSDHRRAVEANITSIGIGPSGHIQFCNAEHTLIHPFSGSDSINTNYSQSLQDIFVLTALNGKRNGSFLEIGGGDPYLRNNTALLERFGWSGISVEFDQTLADKYRTARPNIQLLCKDALSIDYVSLLSDYADIDYLQLDIEPARNTFECLLSIPFDKHRFAVITYEHDYYVDVTRSYRSKSRNYLRSIGYELIAEDVAPDGRSSFEDWWVHPELVDTSRIGFLKNKNNGVTDVRNLMLKNLDN